MTATPYDPATVRDWHAEEGWGVLDSPATPGGCWTHYSVVGVPGYKGLAPGEEVWVAVEHAEQDGFAHRAASVLRRTDHQDPPAPFVEPPWPDADAPGLQDGTGIDGAEVGGAEVGGAEVGGAEVGGAEVGGSSDGPYTSELTLRSDQD